MADAGETTAGDALATALGARFGETSRRARFARCAMAMARGDGEEAEKILREIESSRDGDADGRASRARVAAKKSAGDDAGALRALTEYAERYGGCLLYTSPSPRDQRGSRMPSSA